MNPAIFQLSFYIHVYILQFKLGYYWMDQAQQNLLQIQTPYSVQLIDPRASIQEGQLQNQLLKYKLSELQKVIKSLSSSNEKFLDKIIELQDELQLKQSQSMQAMLGDDYSELQQQLILMEGLVASYKKELIRYDQRNRQLLREKDSEIFYLREEMQKMSHSEIEFMDKLSEKQEECQYYQQQKQRLQREMQILQQECRKSKWQPSKTSKRTNDSSDRLSLYRQYDPFNDKIHQELERLIDKLVKELEYERKQQKEYKVEIKKLQSTILSLQKEISVKTNTIYSQEIKLVKLNQSNHQHMKNRTLSSVNTSSQKNFKTQQQQPQVDAHYERATFHFNNNTAIISKINSRDSRPKSNNMMMTKKGPAIYHHQEVKVAKDLCLRQIIEEKVKLQCREKCILSVKIIDFFLNEPITSFLTDSNLLIKNFKADSFSHCILKARATQQNGDTILSESQLIQNMIWLIDLVMNKLMDVDKNFGLKSHENKILQCLSELSENIGGNSIQDVGVLRKILQQMIYVDN